MSSDVKEAWGERRRYLTDDRDWPEDKQRELIIFQGGNGDWYVAVDKPGSGGIHAVRICTSGGASQACPGLGQAIADAYRAMGVAHHPAPEQPTHPEITAAVEAAGTSESEDVTPSNEVLEINRLNGLIRRDRDCHSSDLLAAAQRQAAMEVERDSWQRRADTAEAENDELRTENQRLAGEVKEAQIAMNFAGYGPSTPAQCINELAKRVVSFGSQLTAATDRVGRLVDTVKWLRDFAKGHHGEQPSHVLLHGLTVDIPAVCDRTLADALLSNSAGAG